MQNSEPQVRCAASGGQVICGLQQHWETVANMGSAKGWAGLAAWALHICAMAAIPVANEVPADLVEPRFQQVGAGLIPRDVVPTLAQDRDGFLWIATGDGLVRYDGHRFRPQERDSPDPARRNLGWIRALQPARDGRLWIGTEADGLAVYDPRRDRVDSLPDPATGPGPAPAIIALAEDRDGGVWIGAVGAGLQHVDPATGRYTHYRSTGQPGALPDDRVQALFVDRAGTLWVGSRQGLSRRVHGSTAFEALPPTSTAAVQLAGQTVQALYQAADDRLWVGTRQGSLVVVDPATLVALGVRSPGAEAPVRSGGITSLTETRDGALWVGHGMGIDLFDARTGTLLCKVRHNRRRNLGLAGYEVTQLLRDQAGAIWVGGFGLGLQRHDPDQDAIRVRASDLQAGDPDGEADIRSLLRLDSGEIWAATHNGGVTVMDAQLRVVDRLLPLATGGQPLAVNNMLQASDGSVWLSGDGQLLQLDRKRRTRRLLQHAGGRTRSLFQSTDGSLWVGTRDGLYRLPPGAPALRRVTLADGSSLDGDFSDTVQTPDATLWVGSSKGLFRIAPGRDQLQAVESDDRGAGLGNPSVIGLLVDSHQTLWVDTGITGLHRLTAWDGRHARFNRVSMRHGIVNRPFGANLLEDAQGRIWSHMSVYDPAGDRLHELTAADGVSFGTGWFGSRARLPDGRLLFGGSRGVLVVQPERFRLGGSASPLRVTELRVNGERQPAVELAKGLTLTREQRSVGIEFAALEYTDPARHRYAYRLEGFDPGWIDTGAELRVASYSNLDPGDYTLRVRATDRSGVWSKDELSVPLRVLPAWWQQGGAKWLAAALLALLFYALLEWRTGRLRRQRMVLEQAVAARTSELEAARAELEDRVQARTRELAAATAAAEAANEAKTVFLHNVSHDMRTPLNAILGLTHLQQSVAADAPQRDRLGQVKHAAQQLLRLINHVLDLSGRHPVVPEAAPPVEAGAPLDGGPTPAPAFHGERVLLAEDDAVNQIVAVGILERAGLVVDVAADGAEAVEMAANTDYALILMDLQMPRLDGQGATRAIRATPRGRELPIVALSAFAFDEDRRRCLEAGMNAHVSKPIDPAVLLQAVRRWLRTAAP